MRLVRPFLPPSNTGRNEWLNISPGDRRRNSSHFVYLGDEKCNMSAFCLRKVRVVFLVYVDKTSLITHPGVRCPRPGGSEDVWRHESSMPGGGDNEQIKVWVCVSVCVGVPQWLFFAVFVPVGLHKSSLCHAEDLMSQYLNSWTWCSHVCCAQRSGLISPTVRMYRAEPKNILVVCSFALIVCFFF